MIIPGWGKIDLDSYTPKNISCRNCKTSGSLIINIYFWRLHFWGIPLFPIRKTGKSNCFKCDQSLKPKKMPSDLKIEYQNLKGKSYISIWQYTGILILIIFFSWIFLEIKKDEINEKEYYETPMIGDTYEYQIEKGKYSTFKIITIMEDSIIVFKNKFNKQRKHKVMKIDKDENYSNIKYSFSKEEIDLMYQQELIFGINRK